MSKYLTKKHSSENTLYARIREILERARSAIARSVNSEMVTAYWHIGREIVVEEQKGRHRAKYGEALLESLSKRLTKDLGRGFDTVSLWNIRQFYRTYPILSTLCRELSWSHYRILMRIENPKARSFYEIECVKNNWSTRELERQKGSLLFERLSLSKDKKGLLKLARTGSSNIFGFGKRSLRARIHRSGATDETLRKQSRTGVD